MFIVNVFITFPLVFVNIYRNSLLYCTLCIKHRKKIINMRKFQQIFFRNHLNRSDVLLLFCEISVMNDNASFIKEMLTHEL